MLRCLRSFITLFLLLIAFSGSAQRVGVVMSGGGAKGLYHIGVLEALEESGIPIDYVAGTSMGSIVAGLYAAGYSPAEMREIVTSGEIEGWLTGRIDDSYGAYYRQYRNLPSLFSLRLDISDITHVETEEITGRTNSARPSIYMPNSLISSTQVDMTLTRLLAAASENSRGNFDNLMVPFLCVASDMRNHQAVTLVEGNLGESIRASMAIPVAFNPVKRDSMVLFDGGIYDNFPWKPLMERHAPDVMIGSICTAGNTELTGQSGLVDQVFAITTYKSDYTMPEGNHTIQRDVNVGMLDFANGDWVIDQGYADAMAQIDEIKSSISERRDSTYYERRRAEYREQIKPLIFEEYEINGLTTEQNLYVRDFLHLRPQRKRKGQSGEQGQRLMSFETLEENLYQILSSGDFATEYPVVKYNELSERYKFFVNLTTKPQLKLSVGGHLSSTAFNQLIFSLNYKEVKRVAQSYYADLYLGTVASSGKVGGRTDFFIKAPLFIDYYYSIGSKNLEYSNLGNVTDVTNTESAKTFDSHFSIGGGMPLSRRSLFSLRANAGWTSYYYDAVSYSDVPDLDPSMLYDRTKLSFAAGKAEYQRSTLNRTDYPTRGSKISLSGIAVLGSVRNYQDLSGSSISSAATRQHWIGGRFTYNKYFVPPTDSWFSLGINVDAVYTTLRQFGNPTATMLMMPAYQPVVHSQMVFMPDFSADKYIGAGVIPIFNMGDNLLLRTGAYVMYRNKYSVDGVDSGVISNEHLHYIGEAAFVYQSPIGALNLSLTKYDISDWNNLYITFGIGIPIFSPKGTFY